MSTHFDTPRIARVSADADEQTMSTFFESPRSRRHFLAAHRESPAARRLSALNVPESTWGFSEGPAYSANRHALSVSRRARTAGRRACALDRPPCSADRRPRTVGRRARAVTRRSHISIMRQRSATIPTLFFPSPFSSHNRGFAEELSATLNLELQSVAVPGQTIRRYTV